MLQNCSKFLNIKWPKTTILLSVGIEVLAHGQATKQLEIKIKQLICFKHHPSIWKCNECAQMQQNLEKIKHEKYLPGMNNMKKISKGFKISKYVQQKWITSITDYSLFIF